MYKRKSVSAIIPVYNEEKTVSKVIDTLLKNNLIDEVICVNDGSTDTSIEVLNQFKEKIEILDLQKNYGKGYALSVGIKQAKGEIVFFVDADLINLSENHINTMLNPVLHNDVRGVIGYPVSKKMIYLNPFSGFSGERVYYKSDLVAHLETMAKTRFGIEVLLNHLFGKSEIKKVPLNNLKGLFKHEKRGFKNTLSEYYFEGLEIIREYIKQKRVLIKVVEN